MTDYNSEQGRELRRARLTKIRPRNAEDMLPKGIFDREYRRFHVVQRELMPDIEERDHLMFCPACHEDEDDALVRARKLHVSYNEDPLRNYRALVTVACKGCGWSEIIPVAIPEALTSEELSVMSEKRRYEAQESLDVMRAQMGAYNYNSGLGQQGHFANAASLRQVSKSALHAAAYGSGPQPMKSLMSGRMGSVYGMSIYGEGSKPTFGQALADHVWSDYEELDRMRAEAAQAKSYVDAKKLREQVMKDMSDQLTKKEDDAWRGHFEDMLTEVKRVPAPPIKGHGKGRITAPPPPMLPPTAEKLREAIMAAPPEARPSLMEKLRGYFR
jgi:hypothetical protein